MFLINFHVVYRFTEITIDNKRIYYFKPLDYFERNIREVKQKKLEAQTVMKMMILTLQRLRC